MYPHAVFYSYAYPEPAGFKESKLTSSKAFYHEDMKEFMLLYEDVQKTADPEDTLLAFLRSSYQQASTLADWDHEKIEKSHFMEKLDSKYTGDHLPLM